MWHEIILNTALEQKNLPTPDVDPRSGVGNFFRPRAIFQIFLALRATLLDKLHHNRTIYKEIV